MVDYFSALAEPRRPWLDAEQLKEKFLALSALVHPDRVHQAPDDEKRAANDRYTALNAAYTCLREPRDRLAHLIVLEHGARPGVIQNIPSDLMNDFFAVGRLLKEADAFLAEKAVVTSPLLKIQFFARGQELSGRLGVLRQSLATRQAALDDELRAMNGEWERSPAPAAKASLLGRLEEIHRLLSYFSRWSAQLQEHIVQLTL